MKEFTYNSSQTYLNWTITTPAPINFGWTWTESAPILNEFSFSDPEMQKQYEESKKK